MNVTPYKDLLFDYFHRVSKKEFKSHAEVSSFILDKIVEISKKTATVIKLSMDSCISMTEISILTSRTSNQKIYMLQQERYVVMAKSLVLLL